jgi:hypothetical protein
VDPQLQHQRLKRRFAVIIHHHHKAATFTGGRPFFAAGAKANCR